MLTPKTTFRINPLLVALALITCAALLLLLAGSGQAQTAETPPTPTPGVAAPQSFTPPISPGISNDTCLTCHGQADQYLTLPSGEQLYISISQDEFHASVHGDYACVQCHTGHTGYPHPENTAQDLRDVTIQNNLTCARCHSEKYDKALDSVHGKALSEGNKNAATCSDCHGAHNVQDPTQPHSASAKMCEKCHSGIFNEYSESVHGAALIGDGNTDVPACIDCHGVHNVQGPSTQENFHLSSPLICAECHADAAMMDKYGISTNVFNSYISDFHGTTAVLFEPEYPGQLPNTPVCIDCHGFHNIKSPDDPSSTVYQENLLATCQQCHPDADENFPAAWLNHYTPDRSKYPLVYYVDLFYKIFIPGVLGFMAFFVIGDFSRRMIIRRKERKHDVESE